MGLILPFATGSQFLQLGAAQGTSIDSSSCFIRVLSKCLSFIKKIASSNDGQHKKNKTRTLVFSEGFRDRSVDLPLFSLTLSLSCL